MSSRIRSSTDSNARYGLIAPAPYPMSSAMWCTSRASPASTIKPGHRALLGAHEVVVDRGGEQQRRDRGLDRVGVAIGQHDDPRPVGDRLRRPFAHGVECRLQTGRTVGDAVQAGDHERPQTGAIAVVVDVDDLGELVVVDDRERQDELAAAVRPWVEQVRLRSDGRTDRGDDLLADRVERRVGHLGEQLLEVVEQQSRALGQHGERRVGAHRAERLHPVRGHRGDEDLQLLVGVAEHLLAAQHAVVAEHDVFPTGQVAQVDHARLEPLAVRMLAGERRLDLVVADDAPLGGVDQEHLARLEAALGDDLRRVDVDHADLRSHHHEVVVGHPVPARAADRCGRAPRRSLHRR